MPRTSRRDEHAPGSRQGLRPITQTGILGGGDDCLQGEREVAQALVEVGDDLSFIAVEVHPRQHHPLDLVRGHDNPAAAARRVRRHRWRPPTVPPFATAGGGAVDPVDAIAAVFSRERKEPSSWIVLIKGAGNTTVVFLSTPISTMV